MAEKDKDGGEGSALRRYLGVFRYSGRALELVWTTSRALTFVIAALTVVGGLLPAAVAYVGKLIVDAVVLASQTGHDSDIKAAIVYVAVELGLVAALAGIQRGLGICESLLRVLLGQRVNVMILEKALELSLEQFEDADFYDKMTKARREASMRPLSLVNRTFGVLQNTLSLIASGGLLLAFSGWAVLVLALASVPAFLVETRFSGRAFRLYSWRAPETRMQAYLESVIARDDNAKEVQIFGLGPLFLDRYREIFHKIYKEDRDLTIRRGVWGFVLGLLSTLAFYAVYGWIVWETVLGVITLGAMTMYLLLFKQGQAAFSAILTAIGKMYEDNLYLSNLYEFLEQPSVLFAGEATSGPEPGDGVRFEGVSFTYPGAEQPSLHRVSFHLKPGEKLALVGENGSGKTTLVKLLSRLYEPSEGRILLDGRDLREWDIDAVRRRVGVIFQDFVRFQLLVGENIGVGDVRRFEEEPEWERAAELGMSKPFIDDMPDGYKTQLGRWFSGGRELSGGQWQKIALSRAFMRRGADILVLDEPTAAMDAEAEAQIFEHFGEATREQMAIFISHRFSTVRMADHIVVLHRGRVVEEGSHEQLMARDGQYARLFNLQARGYR
ncbi:MAG: ABC transporter ATP-binding protein [Nannocystaceae bacterium]